MLSSIQTGMTFTQLSKKSTIDPQFRGCHCATMFLTYGIQISHISLGKKKKPKTKTNKSKFKLKAIAPGLNKPNGNCYLKATSFYIADSWILTDTSRESSGKHACIRSFPSLRKQHSEDAAQSTTHLLFTCGKHLLTGPAHCVITGHRFPKGSSTWL